MKKSYMKPALYAESFELMEHIAGCGMGNAPRPATPRPYQSATACTYTDGNTTIFLDPNIGCQDWYDVEIYGENNYTEFMNDMMTEHGMTCYGAFSSGTPFAS